MPLPTDPVWRTLIAGAVDGDGYVYLASGLTETGSACTAPGSCRVDPGCSDAQPCLLLRAAAPAFAPRQRVG